jgi:hypothetical protein
MIKTVSDTIEPVTASARTAAAADGSVRSSGDL